METPIDSFITHFSKEIEEGNAAVFAGAGLSVSSGYVDWKGLLKPIADELGLDIEKEEHNLVNVAQYHVNSVSGNKQRLIQIIKDSFPLKIPTDNHKILARLPISTYWTTNYDGLIEAALKHNHKISDTKYKLAQLAYTEHKRDAVVYKMHGDINDPDTIVITKDHYERYHFDNSLFITALSGDLVAKTFLFMGFSFTDPNLDYVLSRIRLRLDNNQRQHYCIFKKRARLENETEEDFHYAALKQELVVNDLKRFNIKALLIDDYSEITIILKEIENRFRQNTIFISGSASNYGEIDKVSAERFIQNLSQKLIDENYKIVSGFGLGVGNHVICGVLEEIYQKQGLSLRDQLILRPFPQGEEVQKQWGTYREDMITYAGIAIFLFGNKVQDGNIVLADGVISEFEIAKTNGLKLIPIGATGFVAKQLWEKVINSFNEYYPVNDDLKELFFSLGDEKKSLTEHLEAVVKIINRLQGRN